MERRHRFGGVWSAVVLGLVPLLLLVVGWEELAVNPALASEFVQVSTSASLQTATLGEEIVYTVVYTIPPQTALQQVELKECSPDNSPDTEPFFEFVAGSSSGPDAVGPGTPAVSSVVPTEVSFSNCMRWDLGTIENSSTTDDYVYQITYRTRVALGSKANEVGANLVTLDWDGGTPVEATTDVVVAMPYMDTALHVAGPDGQVVKRWGESGESGPEFIAGLTAGDAVTVTVLFTNVSGLNVTSAYSVLLQTQIPKWITYEKSLSGTPVPSLTTSSEVDGWLLKWYAPGVYSDGVGMLPSLATVAPGQSFSFAFLASVRPGVAPGIRDYVRGFGSADERSMFRTFPNGQGDFHEAFNSYHNILLEVARIQMVRETVTSVPEPSEVGDLYVRHGEVVTYTIAYTLPAGTVISPSVNSYFRDSLQDGLHFGGVIAYPDDVMSPPTITTYINAVLGKNLTRITWDFLKTITAETDLVHTYVYTAWVDSRNFIAPKADEIQLGQSLPAEAELQYPVYQGAQVLFKPIDVIGGRSHKADVFFSRPFFGDAQICLFREGFEGECQTSGDQDQIQEALSVQCDGTVVMHIRYARNGGLSPDDREFNAILPAYNTVVTNTLPPRFQLVDAWPSNYSAVTQGDQTLITWDTSALTVPAEHYIPGVLSVSTPIDGPYFVVTATVPLTAAGGTIFNNQVAVGYQDLTGAGFVDRDSDNPRKRWLDLNMIVKIETNKFGVGARGETDIRVGEVVTYTVVDNVPPGTYGYWPRHTDRLPRGLSYIPGSFQITGASLVSSTAPVTRVMRHTGASYEEMLWWTESLDNIAGLEPLYVTATYQARVTGFDPEGIEVAKELNVMDRKLNMASHLVMEWGQNDSVSPTYQGALYTDPPVFGIVHLHQPLLADPDLPVPKSFVDATSPITSLKAGDLVTYAFVIRNSGYAPAYDVEINDVLPDGMSFLNYTGVQVDSQGNVAPLNAMFSQVGQVLTWSLDEIPERVWEWMGVHVTYTVEIADNIGAGAVFSNALQITDYSGLPGTVAGERYYGDLYAGTTWFAGPLTVVSPTISVEAPSEVRRGSQLVYRITTPQPGIQATLYNVELEDEIPVGLKLDAFQVTPGSATYVDGILSVALPSLVKDDQIEMVITATVLPTATGVLNNQVSLTWEDRASGGDTHQVIREAETLVLEPELELEKTVSAPMIAPDRTFTYTLHYRNTGGGVAYGTRLTDTFPGVLGYLGFYTESPQPVTLLSGLPDLVWSVGDLQPSDDGKIVITATSDAELGAFVTNDADISTSSLGDLSSGNHAEVTMQVTPTAILDLDKYVSGGVFVSGDVVSYTLDYAVLPNSYQDAAAVTVVDSYPTSYLEFLDASVPYTGDPYDGDVSWALQDLAPGTSGSIVLNFRIKAPLPNGTQIVNQATVEAENALAVMDAMTISVLSAPSLNVTLSTDPDGYVAPGEPLVYRIAYENQGTDVAYNVTLLDHYDMDLKRVSTSLAPSANSDSSYTWQLGDLAAGEGGLVLVTGTVPIDKAYGDWLTNVVTLTADNYDAVTDSIQTLVAHRLLSLSKHAHSASVVPGELISYTLFYTVAGTVDNVTLVDTYAPYAQYVSADPSPVDNPLDGDATWTWDSLSACGSVQIVLRAKSPLTNAMLLPNTATIVGDLAVPVEVTTGTPVESSPQLSLSKSVLPATYVGRGQKLVYTIAYSNTGNGYAENVRITEQFDPYLENIVTSIPASEGNNVWDLGSVGYEEGSTLVITATVSEAAPYDYVIANQVELSADNYSDTDVTQTQVTYSTLELSKHAPEEMMAGELLHYTLVYTTGGLLPRSYVVLSESYPAGVTFVSADPPPLAGSNNTVWALGELPTGIQGTVHITVHVPTLTLDGTILVNEATIDAVGAFAPTMASASTLVHSEPVLAVDKVADPHPFIADSGGQLVYTISYSNQGGKDATNVVLTELYDVLLTDIETYPVPDVGDNVWMVGDLAPGEGGTILVTTTVPSGLDNGTRITNQVTMTADTDLMAVAQVETVIGYAYLDLDKQGPDTVDAGGLLTYTLLLTADPSSVIPLENTALTEQYSPDVSFVMADPEPDPGSNNVWSFGTLSPGETRTVVVTVRATSPLTSGWIITNHALASSDTAHSVAAQAETSIVSAPQLHLYEPAGNWGNPGDTVDYVLTYANLGNGYATGVMVLVAYDPQLIFVKASPPPVPGTNNQWDLGMVGYTSGEKIRITVRVSKDSVKGESLLSQVWLQANGVSPVGPRFMRTSVGIQHTYLPLIVRK